MSSPHRRCPPSFPANSAQYKNSGKVSVRIVTDSLSFKFPLRSSWFVVCLSHEGDRGAELTAAALPCPRHRLCRNDRLPSPSPPSGT